VGRVFAIELPGNSVFDLVQNAGRFRVILKDNVNTDRVIVSRFLLRRRVIVSVTYLPSPPCPRVFIDVEVLFINKGRRGTGALSRKEAVTLVCLDRVDSVLRYLWKIKGTPVFEACEVFPKEDRRIL